MWDFIDELAALIAAGTRGDVVTHRGVNELDSVGVVIGSGAAIATFIPDEIPVSENMANAELFRKIHNNLGRFLAVMRAAELVSAEARTHYSRDHTRGHFVTYNLIGALHHAFEELQKGWENG